ncbi:MAG: DUF3108 domain-containing protein [Deltaproteobacteria bacterium]|nr:DUF3108 domain-containing protein [Deltaproteobacteria bacterium]
MRAPKRTTVALARVTTKPAIAARTDLCQGLALPKRNGPMAFGPGEEMSFDFHAAGLFVGRMDIKVGAPRATDGRQVLPLFGRARTTMFTASIQKFEGRYLSLIDARSLEPLGIRTESIYGSEPRAEQVSLSADRRSAKIKFQAGKAEGTRDYGQRDGALFDVLGLLYYARSIELPPNTKVCQEVVGDRRLWRMEGNILGVERIDTPAGKKDAVHVKLRFDRVAHPDFDNTKRPWIEIDLFLSNDVHRAPLAFTVANDKVTARAELVGWSTKGTTPDDDWKL